MGNEKTKPFYYKSNIPYQPLNNQLDLSIKNTFVSLNCNKAEVKLIKGLQNKQFANKTLCHRRNLMENKQSNIKNEDKTIFETFLEELVLSFGHEYKMNLQYCYWSNENLF